MNSTYKLSDMNFVRAIARGILLAAAVVAIFASVATAYAADETASTTATTTVANTAPAITLNGDATTTVSLNSDYTDEGATAQDAEDGNLTSQIVVTGTVATTTVGTSTLTYSVTDSGGLSASAMRDVVVVGGNASATSSEIDTSASSTSASSDDSDATSTPSTGSITFCHIVWNGNAGVFATSSSGLPEGTFTFTAAYAGPDSTSTGSDPISISPISFSANSLNVDTAIFGSAQNGECVTASGLDFGYYTYSESAISNTVSTSSDMQWKATLYNDQYDTSVQSLNDFFTFSSTTNENSDGVISIGENRPDRTLVVLDSFGSAAPTTDTSGGNNGGSGGNGGGSNSGGSSSGGGSHHHHGGSSNSNGSAVGGAGFEDETLSCSTYLDDYLHIGWNNNPIEVKKLQIFLNVFDQSNLAVSGIFDRATFNAVETFQKQYASDILTPWGYAPNEPTGYVYLLTKKKINEIVCGRMIALTSAEQKEVREFNQFLTALKQNGVSAPSGVTGAGAGTVGTGVTGGTVNGDTTGTNGSTGAGPDGIFGTGSTTGATSTASTSTATSTGVSKGTMANLAAAIFSMPQSGTELTRCIFNLIIILAIIYIITSILVNNEETGEAALERSRTRKLWFYFAGVIIAAAFALFFDMFCLVAPLLLALVILAIVLIIRKARSNGPTGNPPTGTGPGQHPLIVENPEPKVEAPVVETPVSTIPTQAPASAEPTTV